MKSRTKKAIAPPVSQDPVAAGLALTTPCSTCKKVRTFMIAMEPGVDGQEWYLCSVCWRQGR